METHKPVFLSVLTRPVRYRGRTGVAIAGLVCLKPDPSGRWLPRTEMTMWKLLADHMPADGVIDAGMPKQRAEYVIHGSAYAPAPQTSAMAVTARVGALSKTLIVHGERYRIPGDVTQSRPFDRVPLDWSQAWGGPDVPDNPVGIGAAGTERPGLGLPVARLVYPDATPADASARIEPAAFAPIPADWPARARWRGTYDDAWLTAHAPGLAPDLDWRHFNVAPQDQWFDGALAGDEAFAFEGMHPQRPVVAGTLPGLAVRMFVSLAGAGGAGALHAVPMRATTLVCFPHLEAIVMVWHGLAECDSDDGHDLIRLVAALDDVNQPRPADHFTQVLARRSDPQQGALHALADGDLLPVGASWVDPDFEIDQAAFRVPGIRADNQFRRVEADIGQARELAISRGLDPDAFGLRMPVRESPPDLASLPALLARRQAEMAESTKTTLAQTRERLEALRASVMAGEAPAGPPAHRGPPTFRALAQLQALSEQVPPGTRRPDGSVFRLADIAPGLLQLEQVERDRYRSLAHTQQPAPALGEIDGAARRADLLARLAAGEPLGTLDLTGAPLQGLDLNGADLRDAWLEAADLRGANLAGATLAGAVLAHANLGEAVLAGADLSGANLGRAIVIGAVFDRADLSRAILSGSDLSGASWRRARFTDASLLETTFGNADLARADLANQLLVERDLHAATLAGADLRGATLVGCDLTGANLAAALLDGARLTGCRLGGARLPQASLAGTVFAAGCDLTGVDLTGARMPRANLRGQPMRGARLGGAIADGADLSETDLAQACLDGASAREALLIRTGLRLAEARGANLMGAILQDADLRSADLSDTNLHGADLSRVRTDPGTRFDRALDTRARRDPRRPMESMP